jgi:hypothetical protein
MRQRSGLITYLRSLGTVINSLYGVGEPRPPEYLFETFDLDTLREIYDTEFKKALGRDGKGKSSGRLLGIILCNGKY